MAEHFKLPVYKAAIDLEKQFVLSTQKTPRGQSDRFSRRAYFQVQPLCQAGNIRQVRRFADGIRRII